MKIAFILEGKTEKVFLPHLQRFLHPLLAGAMPKFDPHPYDGLIPREAKLKKDVLLLLSGRDAADYVIALTDVYTGSPAIFKDAEDAKTKMRNWVGEDSRFYPHAAQYEFEAWLLPYWPTIQQLAGHNKTLPKKHPEEINLQKPPSHYLKEIFASGRCRGHYNKRRDAARILRDNDLGQAIKECSQLKALVNTILKVCNKPLLG